MTDPKHNWLKGMIGDVMGKQERQELILSILAHTKLVLPPKVIYVNLQRNGATFGERTVNRHLSELQDLGLVAKIDEQRGYYEITEKGLDHLNQNIEVDQLGMGPDPDEDEVDPERWANSSKKE